MARQKIWTRTFLGIDNPSWQGVTETPIAFGETQPQGNPPYTLLRSIFYPVITANVSGTTATIPVWGWWKDVSFVYLLLAYNALGTPPPALVDGVNDPRVLATSMLYPQVDVSPNQVNTTNYTVTFKPDPSAVQSKGERTNSQGHAGFSVTGFLYTGAPFRNPARAGAYAGLLWTGMVTGISLWESSP